MVIIGVLATLVSLTVSGRAVDDRMQAESRRIEELLRLASDEAQAKGLELGLRQTTEGFEFMAPDASGAQWTVVEDGLFRPRQVPVPFELELRVDGRLVRPVAASARAQRKGKDEDREAAVSKRGADEASHEPQVLILSSGEMTAFTLDLKLQDSPIAYRVEANVLGELSSARLEPAP